MTSPLIPKPEPSNADRDPVTTLVQTLVNAAVEQEMAGVAALTAGLQMALHLAIPPRPAADLQADFDNMPL